MSEYDEHFSDEETEHLDPNIRAELRKSRERAKEAEAAKAETEALKRELAFTKAGIPETGVGALLRKAYDGDTDPDAIRQAAAEYGININNNGPSESNSIREELETHRQIQGSTGTSNSGPTAQQALLALIQEAGSAEAIMEVISKQGAEGGLYSPGMH